MFAAAILLPLLVYRAAFQKLLNTDACVHGGSCNIRKVLNVSADELSGLCEADVNCLCHNERWLKSDCSQKQESKGTTLYVKISPPTPIPPTPAPAPVSPVWPLPQSMSMSGSPATLSSSFRIVCNSTSQVVVQAIARYSPWLLPAKVQYTQKFIIDFLDIIVTNASEHLGSATNYSYSIDIDRESSTVTAASVYAVVYALETFAQLAANGQLAHNDIRIRDYPRYRHRGLLLDIGRRFYPIPLMHSLIDGLSFAKMNVVHFHMSDFPGFRIKSKVFPNLTWAGKQAGGQVYSQQEITALVEYARLRGVRIVPEIDIPGHAGGFKPLVSRGLQFCDMTRQKTLFDDEENRTFELISSVIGEMSSLFIDELLHLGGDETLKVGRCNMSNFKSFEQKVIAYIQSKGKKAMGWQEVFSDTKAATPGSGVVLGTWMGGLNASYGTSHGFETVESSSAHFYMQQPSKNPTVTEAVKLWLDINAGVADTDEHLLLGGEASLWGNPFCYSYLNCTRNTQSGGDAAHWMYDAKYDAQFAESVTNLLFPRILVAAAAFWNFEGTSKQTLAPSGPAFVSAYSAHARRIAARSSALRGCPMNCSCSATSRCDVNYPQNSSSSSSSSVVLY